MHRNRVSVSAAGIAVVVVVILHPVPAVGQERALGVGPRMSFVRGDAQLEDSSGRFSGVQLRANVSSKTALELSIDYRSRLNESLTERVRDMPVQASLLLYPVRSGLSFYVLGGGGWYAQRVETLADNVVILSETTRTFGYHGGIGGELRIGSRAGVHLDYRYTMIRFGEQSAGEPGALPLPGLTDLQRRLKLSHQGSMWTGGLTVYF